MPWPAPRSCSRRPRRPTRSSTRWSSTTRTGSADVIRQQVDQRNFAAWERLGTTREQETPSELYSRVRRAMIDAERRRVLEIRDAGKVPSDVVAEVLTMLDVEESMLEIAHRELEEHEAPGARPPSVVPAARSATTCRRTRRASARPSRSATAASRTGSSGWPCARCLDVRHRRVLRLLTRPARHRALPRLGAPGDPVRRARRGLALVLQAPPHGLSACSRVRGARPVTRRTSSVTLGHRAVRDRGVGAHPGVELPVRGAVRRPPGGVRLLDGLVLEPAAAGRARPRPGPRPRRG